MASQKKIGIITMHRVTNAGSALQTYALYNAVSKLGYDCEIVDYQYPNDFHRAEPQTKSEVPFFVKLWMRMKYFILYRSRTQRLRFQQFQSQAWKSSDYYSNRDALLSNPPRYDLCITGSDQVWNPRCMKGDSVFFCDFAIDTPRIAYASSFTQGEIPLQLKSHYAYHLSIYKAVGVRERSGAKLFEELTGKQVEVVCDPTLLLTSSDYAPFIRQAHRYTKKRYLLAYILDYAFDPYPTIQQLIERISKEQGLEVIYLMANSINNYKFGSSVTSAGPNEFLRLFSEAAYIVTSSFHGVAFSLLFEKDFYTVIPNKEQEDGRIQSLLHAIGASNRAIKQGEDLSTFKSVKLDYNVIRPEIDSYRERSYNFLRTAIEKAL